MYSKYKVSWHALFSVNVLNVSHVKRSSKRFGKRGEQFTFEVGKSDPSNLDVGITHQRPNSEEVPLKKKEALSRELRNAEVRFIQYAL